MKSGPVFCCKRGEAVKSSLGIQGVPKVKEEQWQITMASTPSYPNFVRMAC